MTHPDESPRMQLNHATTPDYGPGAGKGGEVLGIGVPELKLAAPVFGKQSRKLSRALTTLITTLDGLGEPWGDDPTGENFAKDYKSSQRSIEQAAGVLVLGLVSIHEALDDMKDGHVDNEELIKGMFTKVARGHSGRDEHGK
ncbi:WXG100 family type VII secretion target [Streptomyces smyrnaeus]|uniref:WXG100 family type VII secretion target n=1 Tax=Streptomyces smyrnaeus TaxID=1387713 RepID=UPI00368E0C94